MLRLDRPSSPPGPARRPGGDRSPLLPLLALLLLAAWPARASRLEDLDRALAQLHHPTLGRQARVVDLKLPLAAGSLVWERGLCRVLPLELEGDSLLVVELSGRGHLRLGFPDSLEQVAVRASLGRKAGDKRLRRATLVLESWPEGWPAQADWLALKKRWLRDSARPFHGHGRLARLEPDNPLLRQAAPATGTRSSSLWLLGDPDQWIWEQEGGWARLSRPLHDGSSLYAPVTALRWPSPGEPAEESRRPGDSCVPELPPRLHRPASPGPEGHPRCLTVTAQGSDLRWTLVQEADSDSTRLLFLHLDPRAELDSALWTDGRTRQPASTSRELKSVAPGPWLVVERPASGPPRHLRLQGHSPRSLAVVEGPGLRRAGRAAWFPRSPWWQETQPFRLEDPDSLFPAWLTAGLEGKTDDGGLARLWPEERLPLPLGDSAALCWTPLREQAAFQAPQAARLRHLTPDIANLDLPREREVRAPERNSPVEPLDLGQDADTLTHGMLQEAQVLVELAAAARRLEAWLGPPPHTVLLCERLGPAADRREELENQLACELPPEEPLEIDARRLRSATQEARLLRLETLCRGWWLPLRPADEAAPRWIRWGAARACALLLLEEDRGAAAAAGLRQRALESQLSLFRPNREAALPALGERAEGVWRSAETQDLLAWRFALLLEHLRWRLRDPLSLSDGEYRRLLHELLLRQREPDRPESPLRAWKQALADFLVANGLLERSGFGDVRSLWTWLDFQWRSAELPELWLETGQVESAEGPRLALRARWNTTPVPGTVLPVLARTTAGYTAWNLRAVAREEQYLLPLDPADLLGLEIAPGGSLSVRLHID